MMVVSDGNGGLHCVCCCPKYNCGIEGGCAGDQATCKIPGHEARYRKHLEGNDPVNHPSHYTSGEIECIDAIEAALTPEEFAGFCKGNAMKYVWRAGKKGRAAQCLEKAQWYLNRLIASLS